MAMLPATARRAPASPSPAATRVHGFEPGWNLVTVPLQPASAFPSVGDLVSATDREGNATSYAYSAARPHYLETILDPIRNDFGSTAS
jgi:hypothetical protein